MTTQTRKQPIEYPESDGQPMADNTLQFEYITTIKGGLDGVFKDDPGVFVAGDLLWYAIEGRPDVRVAPDVLVVFGRPKGHRGSYQQWVEDNVPPHVIFEVLSPGNRLGELLRKFQFYDHHGAEEYYVYDPGRGELTGWQRVGGELREIPEMAGWTSPRLGVRFELLDGRLRLHDAAGRPFATYVELVRMEEAQRARAERLAAKLRELGQDPDR